MLSPTKTEQTILQAPNEMRTAAMRWLQTYKAGDFTDEHLHLPAAIASETARLATIEFVANFSQTQRAQYLKTQFAPVLQHLRTNTELAAALGTVIFKPYFDGKNLCVETVLPQNFIPLQVNGKGEITQAIFIQQVLLGTKYYTRLEKHCQTSEAYIVENTAYCSSNAHTLGVQVPLTNVAQWANLSPTQAIVCADGTVPEKALFAVFTMPFANHINLTSPLGVSVFSRAEDLITQANKQYERILWEYEGAELAIDASVGALRTEQDDFVLPRTKQRLFRQLALDGGAGGDLYSVYSPAIRDKSLFHGLNQLLRRIEFACALSYGTLSDVSVQEKTAEEIKMSRQRSYSAVCDVQKNLVHALHQLLWAMDMLTDLYALAPKQAWECTFDCGDAITQDSTTEREQMRADVQAGIAQVWEYRAKFYPQSEPQIPNN